MEEDNTTKVKCPNNHDIKPESRDPKVAGKKEEYITGEAFERNYCRVCGAELEEVELGYRAVRLGNHAVADIFREVSGRAIEVTDGLPSDAELVDIGRTEENILLYFSSSQWKPTNLSKPVEKMDIEFKTHRIGDEADSE